jgi:hypothetical protein
MPRIYLGSKIRRKNQGISVRTHALVCDDAQLAISYSQKVREHDVELRY